MFESINKSKKILKILKNIFYCWQKEILSNLLKSSWQPENQLVSCAYFSIVFKLHASEINHHIIKLRKSLINLELAHFVAWSSFGISQLRKTNRDFFTTEKKYRDWCAIINYCVIVRKEKKTFFCSKSSIYILQQFFSCVISSVNQNKIKYVYSLNEYNFRSFLGVSFSCLYINSCVILNLKHKKLCMTLFHRL